MNYFCKVRGDGSIRADLGFVAPLGQPLSPIVLGQPLRNKRGRNKSGLYICLKDMILRHKRDMKYLYITIIKLNKKKG